jgi:1-deoxy-D-xylulose-5-phosphate synthase
MALLTPSDENQCRQALTTAFRRDQPVAVRYPRGSGAGVPISVELVELPWGKAEWRRRTGRASGVGSPRIALLAFGTVLHPALAAADKLDASVIDMRFVKPLDQDTVLEAARSHDAFVTIEEGCVMGGAGSAVAECLAANGIALPLLQLGLPDQFIEHGDPGKLLALCGLDAVGIEKSVQQRFGGHLKVVWPVAKG